MKDSPYEYDVYVSFNQKDAEAVQQIVQRLIKAGVRVWLYELHLGTGVVWQESMKEALERSACCAVFVGPDGLGPQQSEEVLVNIRQKTIDRLRYFRVIPVLLPGADEARLPLFLRERSWVDFRAGLNNKRAHSILLAAVREVAYATSKAAEESGGPAVKLPPAVRARRSHGRGDKSLSEAKEDWDESDYDASASNQFLETLRKEQAKDEHAPQGEKPPPLDTTPAPAPVPQAPEEDEEVEQESIQQASVSDQPSARDTLGFAPYVKAIATFLTNEKTQPPLTLSVEGEWGSGKSSFMLQLAEELCERARLQGRWGVPRRLVRELPSHRRLMGSPLPNVAWFERLMLRRRVRSERRRVKCLTVEFNPWRHDKENALWASFALEFVRKLSQNMSPPERLRAYFTLLLRRFRWRGGTLVMLRMLFLVLVIAFLFAALVQLLRADGSPLLKAAAGGDKEGAELFRIIQASGVAGYGAVLLFFLSKLREFVGNPFAFDLRKYVESPDYEGNVAFIEQFHEDFRRIVDAYAGGNKVYVFIDDLDRCDVPKAAELMQAINLMIAGGASRLVFVIGMDREKVAAGLAVKNEKLLPYLVQSAARQAAGDTAGEDAPAPAKAAQSAPDIAFGLEYGYNFIEKFIQIPFRVPQPAQMGVRTLLDFIAPLVESAGEGGAQVQPGAEAGRRLGEEGVLVLEEAGGLPRTALDEQDAAEILRKAGASGEVIDAGGRGEGPAAKEPEEREGLMLLERGDSPTVRNIVLMVAPALDYNPRRIKQFINLFRLKAYIAYETGLFRRPKPGSGFGELTLEQLGKFVAIGLRWPRLLAELDEEHTLLRRLQKIANGEPPGPGDQSADNWRRRADLVSLLKFGCVGTQDPFDPKRPADPERYSLDGLDVGKLLQVSPRVNRAAAPPASTARARPAEATEPRPGLVGLSAQDEAAFS